MMKGNGFDVDALTKALFGLSDCCCHCDDIVGYSFVTGIRVRVRLCRC